jgi:putative phosphoribosyl transferase
MASLLDSPQAQRLKHRLPSALPVARSVRIGINGTALEGYLSTPLSAKALVVFPDGRGDLRFSRCNRWMAEELNQRGFATLLVDLLTPTEEALDRQTAHLRFDVEILAERLLAIGAWVREERTLSRARIGLFSASIDTGAALIAAATVPKLFGALVSRGGRPDLAGSALRHVSTPTLLIVGSQDEQGIRVNDEAMGWMKAEVRMSMVPSQTSVLDGPATSALIAKVAGYWFKRYLCTQNN